MKRFFEWLGIRKPEPEQPDVIEALFYSLLLRQTMGRRSQGNAPIPSRFWTDPSE